MNPLPASRDATIENRAFAAIAAGGATSIARAPAGADAAGVAAGARVPVILTNGAGFAPTRIACETAALAAALGGLDGFVFTGGIGEHAPEIRAAVCERLRWVGVVPGTAAVASRVSAPESRVEVHVIPTNEEAMIGQHTLETLAARIPSSASSVRT